MTIRSTIPQEPPPGQSWEGMMDIALQEARLASAMDEVPVGAALFTLHGELIGQAHNQPIGLHDPTAHAEVLCLREGAKALGNYRLTDTILVVTLEPCIMCVGALLHARVAGVVFGATDPRSGALISQLEGGKLPFTNHRIWHVGGVQQNQCSELLKEFFAQRRKR